MKLAAAAPKLALDPSCMVFTIEANKYGKAIMGAIEANIGVNVGINIGAVKVTL